MEAGHEVAFASTPIFCSIITEHGFRCFPVGIDDWLKESQESREGTPQPAEPEQSASVFVNHFVPRAERDLPELLAIASGWHPDVLVRETSEFGACAVAEHLGLPHAAVQISAFRSSLHQLLAPPLDRLRASIGLPPDPNLDMLYRYLLLVPFPPRYQDTATPLPETAHAIRHISFDLDRPGDTQLPAWVEQLPERPTVYATLGTAYNRTPDVFSAILAALRDEPFNLIVTLGPGHDPADFGEQPPQVHIERYIPQSLIFPHCHIIITHGGSGTVRTAIDHGLPMVIIPIAADMPDNARRCAALGLARIIAPHERTPDAIREATRTLLHDPRYRQNAERLRDEAQALPGLEYAVELLERLVRERQPLMDAK